MLVFTVIRSVKYPKKRKTVIFSFLANILVAVSLIYFVFVVIWGLNYNRLPFSKIANFDTRPASVKELADLCENIIQRTNALRKYVALDEKGVMYIPGGYRDVFKRSSIGYERAATIYSVLSGTYGIPKSVIFSNIMSYTGISGVYFPFTAEANVNTAVPNSMIPNTACHEMAHQRGFAREDEANYISYLTCSMHPDSDFQYSGSLLALIYSMNALYNYDQTRYNQLHLKCSKGVIEDLSSIDAFWKKYQGPVEQVSDKINNIYLKANMQKDGVYSYGRMVDLLIAEFRMKLSK